ncbi:MarR family transcriptional regulator [Candidatus Woesearchaeota archaeon]|nr:MarR family transcriptional regulator [Candidatus Woesearchaeota archaeon]
MNNRLVGYVIIGIAIVVSFIVYSFNRALVEIVNAACTHGSDCPMWGTINFQTNIATGLIVLLILVGGYFVFFGKEKKRVEPKQIKREDYETVMNDLSAEEKQIFEKVLEAQGTIFQSDLVEKTGLTKVKMTRLLDRLEGRGLIERKRRGMTNVVVLKHR